MQKLSFVLTILSVCTVQLSLAQVLTTGEPATATNTKYVLPGNPKSMTVADEGASSGYIIGKRVNPDKKKNQAKSPGNAVVNPTDKAKSPIRRSNRKSMRGKVRKDSVQ